MIRGRGRLDFPVANNGGVAARAGETRKELAAIAEITKLHWTAYLWPGLPHLWIRGSWAGLTLAVGFTVLLNALLATILVWRDWFPGRVQSIGVGVLVTIWVLAWLEARADWRRYLAELSSNDGVDPRQRIDQWYRDAQRSYLTGDWVAAEQTLLKLLKNDANDAEARLLLAAMWRRLGRGEDACRELDQLERLEAGASWQAEIAAERRLMEPARESETDDEFDDQIDDEPTLLELPTQRPLAA